MNEANKGVRTARALLLLAAAGAALLLTACNTVEGAGKDLQEASQNVKEAIND